MFEQGDEAINLADRIFVGFRGGHTVLDDGIDQHRDGLRHAIEDEQFIRDQEIHRGRAEFIVRRSRHDRLDVVNEFVADETDGAARETRQARHGHRPEALQNALDDLKTVAHAILALLVGFGRHGELLDDFAVFDHFDAIARLLDDGARVASDERVAPEMFAAFDRFEKKRFALAANFFVGRKRRLKIGEKAARDRNRGCPVRPVSRTQLATVNTFCLASCERNGRDINAEPRVDATRKTSAAHSWR